MSLSLPCRSKHKQKLQVCFAQAAGKVRLNVPNHDIQPEPLVYSEWP